MLVVITDNTRREPIRFVMRAPEGMSSIEIESCVENAHDDSKDDEDSDSELGRLLEEDGFEYVDALHVDTGD